MSAPPSFLSPEQTEHVLAATDRSTSTGRRDYALLLLLARRLESEAAETRRLLMVTGSVEAQELVASDLYLHHLAIEKRKHFGKIAEWQARANKQEQVIVEARRRVRLMEKLEEREYINWKAGVDREQENLSSELYLARWKRPK